MFVNETRIIEYIKTFLGIDKTNTRDVKINFSRKTGIYQYLTYFSPFRSFYLLKVSIKNTNPTMNHTINIEIELIDEGNTDDRD